MSNELLDQFVETIDQFKQAVVEGRADLATASKFIEAGMRIVTPAPIEALESETGNQTDDVAPNVVGAQSGFDTAKTDVSQNENSQNLESGDPESYESKAPETTDSTPLESLGLSAKAVTLLKRSDNGRAFESVEDLKAFLADGGDLSDDKTGIGNKIEQEILGKFQSAEPVDPIDIST